MCPFCLGSFISTLFLYLLRLWPFAIVFLFPSLSPGAVLTSVVLEPSLFRHTETTIFTLIAFSITECLLWRLSKLTFSYIFFFCSSLLHFWLSFSYIYLDTSVPPEVQQGPDNWLFRQGNNHFLFFLFHVKHYATLSWMHLVFQYNSDFPVDWFSCQILLFLSQVVMLKFMLSSWCFYYKKRF